MSSCTARKSTTTFKLTTCVESSHVHPITLHCTLLHRLLVCTRRPRWPFLFGNEDVPHRWALRIPSCHADFNYAIRLLLRAVVTTIVSIIAALTLPLADALIFPFPARFAAIAHYRAFCVPDTPPFAAYHQWVNSMRASPAVIATLSPDSVYVTAYGAVHGAIEKSCARVTSSTLLRAQPRNYKKTSHTPLPSTEKYAAGNR